MSKQYICYSGWIKSRSDGQMHYVQASKLASYYKVNPNECIFIDSPGDLEIKTRGYTPEALEKMQPLYPRDDGDYTI